jgi:TatD DNase family protein
LALPPTGNYIFATVGVHPCSCKKFDNNPDGADSYFSSLESVAAAAKASGTALAFGEIGLDYDRLFLCPKDLQLKYFEAQLAIAVRLQLPLFLHSRAAHADFTRLLRARLEELPRRGVVHSFTGTVEEMEELVEMGFDIGVNGCSMKTMENVNVVKLIPLNHIQLETDGPWCEMRPSHASAEYLKGAPPLPESKKKEKFVKGLMVKGRNEAATIPHVAWAVAKIRGMSVEALCEAAWYNSIKMFGFGETA